MTPKVLATILTIVQWRPRQEVESFCQDGEDVCTSRGRTVSPRRVHPHKVSRTAMRNGWHGSDSWSDNHGRGWHVVRERFGQRHTYSVILPIEWVDPQGDVPRAIRRQHRLAVYVPLMWACLWRPGISTVAVGLGHAASGGPPIIVGGVEMAGEDAVYAGWDALREILFSWGIATREDLSEWIHNQGFVSRRWGAHFCARVSVCVQITLQACQRSLSP